MDPQSTSLGSKNDIDDADDIVAGPSKSEAKRECHHLTDMGDEILKLSAEDRQILELPDTLDEAIDLALRIKTRSGKKRQRRYIGKLLRSIDRTAIETNLKKIQHRHDINTDQFKQLEQWRDKLIDNDKQTLNQIIAQYPAIDRQHINQLIRAAHQEKKREKPPAAARKLFKYLRELQNPDYS